MHPSSESATLHTRAIQCLRFTLITCFSVLGLSYGFVTHAQTWDYAESFDELTDGELDGQSSWTYVSGIPASVTSTWTPYEGAKHLLAETDNNASVYDLSLGGLKYYGEFYVSIKSEDPTDSFVYFKARKNEANGFLFGINSTLTGQISYAGAETQGNWTDKADAYGDTYYRIGIRYNASSNGHMEMDPFTAQINVNGGAWTTFGLLDVLEGIDNLQMVFYSDSGTKRVSVDEFSVTTVPIEQEPWDPFTVSQGGTGTSTLMLNGVLIGNGTDDILATDPGAAYQVLRVPEGGGMPSFGALDLSQSTAVTGLLGIGNGGTGLSSFTTGDLLYSSDTDTLAALSIGEDGQVLKISGGIPVWGTDLSGGGTSFTAGIGIRADDLATSTITVDESALSLPNIGGILPVSKGGTGLFSIASHGLLYTSATDTLVVLPIGANNQILKISGGVPTWGTDATGTGGGTTYIAGVGINAAALATSTIAVDQSLLDLSSIGGTLPVSKGGTGASAAFTPGSVIFAGASGVYSQNNSVFFWDQTNNRLGIGTATPENALDVTGTAGATHFKGTGARPSISTGSCAGTNATATVMGTDTAGTITLVTTSPTPANATCFTLTYANAFGSTPHVIFSPVTSDAAGLLGTEAVYASSTESNFTMSIGGLLLGTGLTNNTVYKWSYNVIE